jgi:glutaredoxin
MNQYLHILTGQFPVLYNTRVFLCAAAAVLLLANYPAAGADKLYKWVDENGNVTYQDRPPPGDPSQVETFVDEIDSTGAENAPPPVDVVLYSIEVCDICDLVRTLLSERGVPFEEKNVEGSLEVQAELRQVSGLLTVPVLVIDEQVLKGYNRDLILNELEEAGFSIAVRPPAESDEGPSLTREDLEEMTPQEIEQAARDAVSRGEDNDLFEEDEGFATLNEDIFDQNIFDDDGTGSNSDDITELEEIPEDERIRIDNN